MVLSSQAQRRGMGSSGGGGYVSTFRQKRRRRVRRIAAGVGLVLALYLVYAYWPGGEPAPATAVTPGDTDAAATAGPAPAPRTAVNPGGLTAPIARGHDIIGLPEAPKPIAPAPVATPAPQPKPPVAQPAPPKPAAAADSPKGDVKPTPTPAASPPSAPAPAPAAVSRTSPDVRRTLDAAKQMIANDQFVDARRILSKALLGDISDPDADAAREDLRAINDTLVFSAKIVPNDPAAEAYVIQQGDLLAKLAQKYDVPWTFIARINDNLNPNRIRAGQRIKLIRGPFHVVVHKHAFRLDTYLGDPVSPDALFIRSFPVGLGADDGTPTGRFVVRRQSKLVNPEWTNPRTGEKFLADNPKNPLGEFWIGLDGIDDETRKLAGYGIHGTIEPQTIGKQASMGCVRLRDADIELLFHMLQEADSTVTILP